MTLTGTVRSLRYRSRVRLRAAEYADVHRDELRRFQLLSLNREWQRTSTRVPYYRELRAARRLPGSFRSLEEFRDLLPVATREDVQSHRERMTSDERPPDSIRQTGGSTSRPVSLPAWRSETRFTDPDLWLGRSWYDVTPASRMFMIWGHSHLLGHGLAARIRGARRGLADSLLGYRRYSAYDLRPEALRKACNELVRWRPSWMLGYSVALDMFATVNADRRTELRELGLKVVVATAEAFPRQESASELSALFDCPVAMEYGAVETGLMAHSHPAGGYFVFWRNHLLDAERGPGGHHVVRVTSLYPRSFPLVRYEIGDEIALDGTDQARPVGLSRFESVIGRCNDYVTLDDGSLIHSEAFSHVVRACQRIRGFQIVKRKVGIAVRYVADRQLDEEDRRELRRRLRQIHPQLESAEMIRVEALPQTVAGKTRMIVDETP